ncbi:ribonuclease H-like domain-containing protein [Tanacetum coccineum]
MHWQSFPCSNSGKNGNSWVPIPVTATETGPSTGLKMTVPSTAEEKTAKKNDVKARRNEATRKTQKALLKQQYENFNASSSESLDSIFNRLQKLVSRLANLGVVTPPEDLNVKFLRSLPSEWDTHVIVWMNRPNFDTMGLDDLYNNFKIVDQEVKKSVGTNNDDKNLAFLTTSGASSTNIINTANPEVSTGNTKVNTTSTEISTASFSDATVYAFLSTQPQGSQLVHEDLEQLHDDDLEEMDLKWNMALLSMRARKFYQRTGRKIIIDGSSTAGYDKSKVECFNCHKMGHFARECRAPRSKDNRNWNQGSSSKAVRIEDASEKAMCAIDGAGFDWSDMAEEEIQANMALMAFSDSEVTNDKSCSKSCLQNYEALKKQYDDLLVKLDDTGFKASTYKRGLSILEGQILKYKESEVLFSEEIALLKRSVGKQGVSKSSTSSQQDQDWIVMPIWKDASYFGDDAPRSVADAPIQDKDRVQDENDATEKSSEDSSLEDNGTADQQVNTASPEVNTGSRDVSTDVPEVNTATPEDLYLPLPHKGIHKEATIDIVIGDVQFSFGNKDHKDLHTCLFACFLSQEEPKRVSKALSDPNHGLVSCNAGGTLQSNCKRSDSWDLLKIEEEVYVCQPLGFEDPDHPDKVYKVVKALYGLQSATKSLMDLCVCVEKLYDGKFQMTVLWEKCEISALLPTDLEKPLVQDGDAADVDEHLYRSMIGSLMYLTASRPDIMFAVCACARFQVSPKTSHLLAVKRIFRYLKGKPSLGLWYPKDSPLELVAYTDSDYAGATQDRKSTTGGCQFLGSRLISWQCKKQTVVATSTTEAEYVAAANCCGQGYGLFIKATKTKLKRTKRARI